MKNIESPQWYLKRLVSVGKNHRKALEKAIEEGKNIASGTDQLPSELNDGTTATAGSIKVPANILLEMKDGEVC